MKLNQGIFLKIVSTFMMGTSVFAGPLQLSGSVKVDGSSTVFPISEAIAEEFQKVHGSVKVTVGVSGTGGGFKKFAHGEIDISGASRPISETEKNAAKENKIQFVEIPVAIDGLTVMVNPKNDWVTSITVEELKKIWQPQSTVKLWSDVRETWPKRKMNLYGPGTDSGTFDYFTEVVVGKAKASRPDYTASEDDNVLVQGISGDRDALGYLGYSYYKENKERLKSLGISDGKNPPVFPSDETILKGIYKPLSRPLFIYVNKGALGRPEIEKFVNFYVTKATALVPEVGYVPLSQTKYDEVLKRFEDAKTAKYDVTMKDLL